MTTYPCPACHAEHYPHRFDCRFTTCAFCGLSLLDGASIVPPETRAGEFICAHCAIRLPRCEVCVGTGMTLAGDRETVVTGNPCSECHGYGFIEPGDRYPYAGRLYCDDRECPDCRDRAERAAEDRTETMAKERAAGLDTAHQWGRR